MIFERGPRAVFSPDTGDSRGGGDPKESADNGGKLSKAEASSRLLELSQQYGLPKIPAEELAKIGYTRTAEGRITRDDVVAKVKETADRKLESVPFETIEVSVPMGRRNIYRKFATDQGDDEDDDFTSEMHPIKESIKHFESDIRDLHRSNAVGSIVPAERPFHSFAQKFAKYLEQISVKDDAFVEEAYKAHRATFTDAERDLLSQLLNDDVRPAGRPPFLRFGNLIPDLPENDHQFLQEMLTAKSWPENQIEDCNNAFERIKGRFGDIEEMRKQQWDLAADIKMEYVNAKYPNFANIAILDVQKENPAAIMRATQKLALASFFRSINYEELAGKIESARYHRDIDPVLAKASIDDLPVAADFRAIRAAMREATTVDEKKSISARKKTIEGIAKEQKQLLEGARQYLDPSAEVSHALVSKVEKLQDAFIVARAKAGEMITLRLDGRINPELDRDPGRISGDCTAGRPLPFDNPQLMLYNVKVFTPSRHVGNMYLLVTKSGEEKVWHFDATQIPLNLAWSADLIGTLVDELARAAQKKGVSYITVNREEDMISNYDYIRDAVAEYAKKQNQSEYIMIEIPRQIAGRDVEFDDRDPRAEEERERYRERHEEELEARFGRDFPEQFRNYYGVEGDIGGIPQYRTLQSDGAALILWQKSK